jgi:hypothetical protein
MGYVDADVKALSQINSFYQYKCLSRGITQEVITEDSGEHHEENPGSNPKNPGNIKLLKQAKHPQIKSEKFYIKAKSSTPVICDLCKKKFIANDDDSVPGNSQAQISSLNFPSPLKTPYPLSSPMLPTLEDFALAEPIPYIVDNGPNDRTVEANSKLMSTQSLISSKARLQPFEQSYKIKGKKTPINSSLLQKEGKLLIALKAAELYCSKVASSVVPTIKDYKLNCIEDEKIPTPVFEPIKFFDTYSFDELGNLAKNANELKTTFKERLYKLDFYLFDIIKYLDLKIRKFVHGNLADKQAWVALQKCLKSKGQVLPNREQMKSSSDRLATEIEKLIEEGEKAKLEIFNRKIGQKTGQEAIIDGVEIAPQAMEGIFWVKSKQFDQNDHMYRMKVKDLKKKINGHAVSQRESDKSFKPSLQRESDKSFKWHSLEGTNEMTGFLSPTRKRSTGKAMANSQFSNSGGRNTAGNDNLPMLHESPVNRLVNFYSVSPTK